jgi:nuclear transport factor 2 (NTF2) superfamily protein
MKFQKVGLWLTADAWYKGQMLIVKHAQQQLQKKKWRESLKSRLVKDEKQQSGDSIALGQAAIVALLFASVNWYS